jgi:TetR/AcrR family transcriptional repressor of bet genes
MSRKSNSEQRRAQIVAALLGTMAEHGYEKATIQLIARKAELAPGLLHYHFKTKVEILVELVKTLAELSRARYLAMSAQSVTAEQNLHAYINARLGLGDGVDGHAVAAWVVIGAEAVRQPEVRQVYQEAAKAELALIESLLDGCMREQGRRTANVPFLAAGLLAFMEGAFQLASAAPGVMPAGFAASTALQLVQRYIAGEVHD